MIFKNYMSVIRAVTLVVLSGISAHSQTITGHLSVCLGASRTTLSIGVSGGTWSSGDNTKATINSSTGVVTGVSAGTVTISYNVPPSTVYTAVVTVNPYPMSAIGFSSGTPLRCTGGAPATCVITPTSGNTWTSSNTSVATINTSGFITPGASVGTTVISYRHLSGNCYVSTVVSVNPTPTVSVTSPVCNLTTQTATATPSGGTWMSSNTSVGSIGATSGVLSVFTGGGTTLYYTTADGCRSAATILVNPVPNSILGGLSVCEGNNTTLSCSTPGGTWVSSVPANATIGSTSGVVSGINAGTSTISYVLPTGCQTTTAVSVNTPLPSNTGPTEVCVGQSITISNVVSGGTWSSSAPTKATVTTGTGVIVGISAGTANISYRLSSGCYTVTTITVNAALSAITGPGSVCVGSTITLSHPVSGGTWSTASSLASIGSATGVVTGFTPGAAIVTYTLGTGCFKTFTVQVRANPTPITGLFVLCSGGNVTLTTSPTGGTWVSGNTATGTIGASSGIFKGLAAGTSEITYTATTGCRVTQVVSVNGGPGTITGTPIVCAGNSTTLTPPYSGGVWSTSSAAVAGITTTGSLNGISAGNATISYTIPGGCISTIAATVLPLPALIVGPTTICSGTTTTLTNATAGGTWSSSNSAVATINPTTGLISGGTPGIATITYTRSNGCIVTRSVTVSTASGTISGSFDYCVGESAALSSSTAGGTWVSGSIFVAAIDTFSGVITAVAAGTANITYVAPGGCPSTQTVTVNANPSSISGLLAICTGATSALSASPSGGTWSSSNITVASVNPSGLVSGSSSGTSNITYTLPAGCFATEQVTVNGTAGTLGGSLIVCESYSTTLTSSLPGGTWSSSAVGTASVVPSTGVVTGVASGTATMTYTIGGGCNSTIVVTVISAPATIGGASSLCSGTSTTLTNSISGGTWSSANPSVATVGSSSGVVNGVANGTTTITYSVTSGCYTTKTVTVTAAPGPITGSVYICGGANLTLSVTGSGGTWNTSDPGVAVVGSTGVVTGVAGGTATISYGSGPGCMSTTVVTVLATPSAITGTTSMCVGSTSTLTATGGSYWSSSNSGVATVGSATGTVTGVAAGTARISVTNSSTGCFIVQVVTINTTPTTISGSLSICESASSTLSSTPSGGTWMSGNVSVASIDPSSGVAAGIMTGTAGITYTSSAGCIRTAIVTVNSVPSAGTISGSTFVTMGSNIALTGSVSGGTWSSSNTAIATVGSATASVHGVSVGTVTITHTITNSCGSAFATYVVTVNAANPITGTLSLCPGGTTALSNSTSGGTWSSGTTSVATISSSGVVSGIAAGTSVISYIVGAGTVTATVTVNADPTISGVSASLPYVCEGTTTTVTLTAGSSSGTGSLVHYTWSGPGMSTTTNTTGTINVTPSATSTYSLAVTYTGSGCISSPTTTTLTMNPRPSVFGITGGGSFCSGGVAIGISGTQTAVSYQLYTGGSSVSTIVGTGGVGSFGTFTTAGSYSATATNIVTGCVSNMTGSATVSPISSVSAISGSSVLCPGSSTALSSTTTGGTWSTSDPTVATVGSTGVALGVALGVATISYSVPGCFATKSVTVSPAPATIAGSLSICAGTTTSLFSATSGGTWTSSTPFVANVGYYTGVASATTVGTTTITYSLGSGCITTAVLTVNTLPSAITGATAVCAGANVTLSSASSGGVWTSSNTSVASAATGGVITGVAGGTAVISYTFPSTGCVTSRTISVDAAPAAGTISAPTSIAVGSTTTLTSSLAGGTWSSSAPSIANIVYVTGFLSGSAAGTAVISYTRTNSCGTAVATHAISVTAPRPAPGYVTEGSATMEVYPNPANGLFTVSVASEGTLTIFSYDGRVLISQQAMAGGNTVAMPVGTAAGNYVIRYEAADHTIYSAQLSYKP